MGALCGRSARWLGTVVVAAVLVAPFVSAGAASVLPARATAVRSILVKVAPGQPTPVLPHYLRVIGRTLTGVDVVSVGGGMSLARALAVVRDLPGVVYAEPNALARAALSNPNDRYFGSDWAWSTLSAVAGWSVYPGAYDSSGGATIAVVDTGVDASHPDLSGRILTSAGANCVTTSGACTADPAADDNGHGTHVAGIAAAATNNTIGVAGTAFDAQVIPVKVLNSSGYGSYAAITNGIVWAAQHGARVINLSIGGTIYSQTVCDAVEEARAEGAVVVAAAGNFATSVPSMPAGCPGAVGVAATDQHDQPASFSDYGAPDVFVSAPGVSIFSTYAGGGYATMSGTSMAAAFVSGLASQLIGQLPQRTPDDVARLLATTSDKVGSSPYGADPYGTCTGCTWSASFGYGRIDLQRALAAPDFAVTVSPSSASTPMGQSAAYTVSVSSVNGFSGSVQLSASGLPPGTTATFSPSALTAPGTAQLTVTTMSSVLPAAYAFQIVAASGAVTKAANATLVVTVGIGLPPAVPPLPAPAPPLPAPPPLPTTDFGISVIPSTAEAGAGLPQAFVVELTTTGGSIGAVDLSVSGLPAGAAAELVPASTSAPGASTLTVLTSPTTPSGVYAFTVTAASGGFSHSAIAWLTVK
jgi:thermitase